MCVLLCFLFVLSVSVIQKKMTDAERTHAFGLRYLSDFDGKFKCLLLYAENNSLCVNSFFWKR